MGKPNTRVVWVAYSLGSGAVHALYFREPKTVKPGYGVVKATLDEKDIQQPHHLRVVGERVVHAYSVGV